ncbi:Zinc finger AN1 domain-containing stress-associated protein 12 [Apostasia shenzhenica]|uniref:Zinc finger AN1 domain-containing stress-associated protein 12 n=1 Tax=Apostasia shenzhenica TaxID=1088818 RepID=A0A2I0AFQ8_9ASPA|nr:Zinc finger AN1 domain-containing stress-associated protein 12 [Apostasia shenzhenica]
MGGGTEAFPDLGDHCQHDDCHQLDFLPFTCEACGKIFCLEHRTYRAHGCPSADRGSRTVAVCQICSAAVEKEEGEDDESAVSRHERSGGCDASRKRSGVECREKKEKPGVVSQLPSPPIKGY